MFGQFGHFGDTACIVGYGTVSVDCDGHASGGQHTDCGDRDAVQACELIGNEDTDCDDQDRPNGGHHADAQTGDDRGGSTRLGLLCDLLDALVIGGGVDFRDLTDERTDDQTCDNGQRHVEAAEEDLGQDDRNDCGQDGSYVGAHVERLGGVGLFVALNGHDTDDGAQDADSGDDEREDRALYAVESKAGSQRQSDGGNDGTDIGFEQVGTHTGDIAYVVAYVVCDNGGVAGVILGDACFDLTDQVGAYVCSLGIDTAADTAEQSHGRSTQTETGEAVRCGLLTEQRECEAYAQDAQADDAQTHNGTAAESDLQSLVHAAFFCSPCSSDVTLGSDLHAEEACQYGKCCAANVQNCGDPVDSEPENDEEGDNDDDHRSVFSLQERHSAFMDKSGDLGHAFIARGLLPDPAGEHVCYAQGDDAYHRSNPH